MNVFEGTSGHRYAVDQRLGSGGQGTVYRVHSQADGTPFALKWYHPSAATPEQRTRLQTLAEQGVPRLTLPGIAFCWPIEIVSHPEQTGYGYTMPLVDTSTYVSLNKIITGKVPQPDPRALARLSYLVCLALDTIHGAGMAYCDINVKNVVFDPQQARVTVWDTDNIVVNHAEVEVQGVWEYMAPEVALGQARPNTESDLYSMAVLLYHLWLWEHPMDGALTFAVNCWDIPAKREFYASHPLFAFHPTDTRNAAAGVHALALSVQRWKKTCPPVLQQAFLHSFTEGVNDPAKRIRLADWRRVFLALEANAYPCPTCTAFNLMDGTRRQVRCFHCDTPLRQQLVLRNRRAGSRAQLLIHPGALLRGHHLGWADTVAEADRIVGTIEVHPHSPGAYILRNRSQESWVYATPQGQFFIEPDQARPLLPDAQLYIGPVTLVIESLQEVQ